MGTLTKIVGGVVIAAASLYAGVKINDYNVKSQPFVVTKEADGFYVNDAQSGKRYKAAEIGPTYEKLGKTRKGLVEFKRKSETELDMLIKTAE